MRIAYSQLEIAATARAVARSLLDGSEQLSLRNIYDRVESAAPQVVEAAVVAQLRYLAISNRVPFFTGAGSSFVYDSVLHECNVVPHATELATLEVALIETTKDDPKLNASKPTTSIIGLGRYDTIELFTSRVLEPFYKQLLAAAREALETLYSEMMEWTFRRFASLRTDAASALYQAVRRNIPEPHANDVWIWAFAHQQDFYDGSYIADLQARDVVFDRATTRRNRTKRSPAALAADFLTHVLPLEKSFTSRSIATGRPVTGEFSTAPYLDEGLGTTEQAVFQSNGLIVQPLVSSDFSIIVAAYPAALGSRVMQPLMTAAPELRLLLQATEESLHAHRRDLEAVVAGKPEPFLASLWNSMDMKIPLPLAELDIKELFSRMAVKKRRGKGD